MKTAKDTYNRTMADDHIKWLNKKDHPLTKNQVIKLLGVVGYELDNNFESEESDELYKHIDNFRGQEV